MKKILMIVAVVGGLSVTLTEASAQSGTADNYQVLVRQWQTERDEVVVSLVMNWLREKPFEVLRGDLTRLVRLEVLLSNETSTPLYVAGFRHPDDLEASIHDVVRQYLERNGVIGDTRAFFLGRAFNMAASGSGPGFAFGNWNEKVGR